MAVVNKDLEICWLHPEACFGISKDDFRAVNIVHGKNYNGLAPAADFLGLAPKDICSAADAIRLEAVANSAMVGAGGGQELVQLSFNQKSHIRRTVFMHHAKNLYSFLTYQDHGL